MTWDKLGFICYKLMLTAIQTNKRPMVFQKFSININCRASHLKYNLITRVLIMKHLGNYFLILRLSYKKERVITLCVGYNPVLSDY